MVEDLEFALEGAKGDETFFVLSSCQPLVKLDKLLGDYAAAGVGERPSIAVLVLAELHSLRKQHRGSLSTKASRPVRIGGQMRGTTSFSNLGQQVEGGEFFLQTVTIDHH